MPLTSSQIRALRAGAQLLGRPDRRLSVAEATRRLCGVQAQDMPSARLAIRARTRGLTAADVDRARLEDRSVAWCWVMRGTLHLLEAGDATWIVPLLAPLWLRAGRRRLRELGLTPGDVAKARRSIERMLGDQGPMTRHEIADRLAGTGIRTEGQATIHLIRVAALHGVACLGPDRGRATAFVLCRDWLAPQPPARDRSEALGELALRHLGAYGPATPADLAAWSGLPIREAREGWSRISSKLREVEVPTGPRMWILRRGAAPRAPSGIVRLLPSFDTYLLGWQTRDHAVAPEHARTILPGGGWLHPVALSNGRAVATWRSKRRARSLDVAVQPFEPIPVSTMRAIRSEARDVARFLGLRPGDTSFAD